MGIIKKIKHRIEQMGQTMIIQSQYPMLTSISRKRLQKNGVLGVVYMLHHISKKNPRGIPTNEELKVSPSFLNKLILKYKKEGIEFLSLDGIWDIINSKTKTSRPFVAFTIDDGYLDNYTYALPIFERHKVPFAIFVATDFIDQKAILWWDILEELVIYNNIIPLLSR